MNGAPGIDSGSAPQPVDASVEVRVSSDKMTASVFLFAPQNGGKGITAKDIHYALSLKKVLFGIDEKAVERLAASPDYVGETIVANGQAPKHGVSSEISYKFRLTKEKRPLIREDGTADLKDLGIIENVSKGQLLCEKNESVPGIDGMNVLGTVIRARPGKDVPMPVGKNTVLSEDKLQLFSAADGQAELINRRVSVLEVFVVEGDVSLATGDIKFVGSVQVLGSVLAGFKIEAGGNVTINGSVENADITAKGSIFIGGGMNGMSKGELHAGENITSKYLQNCRAYAGGDVCADVILSSEIFSGGNVRLEGTKATIIAGRCLARTSVTAKSIGSKNSPIMTVIEVGNDPALLARDKELPKEIAALQKEQATLSRLIALFNDYEKAGRLDEEKAESLSNANYTFGVNQERLSGLLEEQEETKQKISEFGYGKISATDCIYPGVKLVIGHIVKNITAPTPHSMAQRVDDVIYLGSAT